MLGKIVNAILSECQAFLAANPMEEGTVGQIIFKTQFKPENIGSYAMPLIILDVLDGPETTQYLGGATRVDWIFAFNAYNYEPDQGADETATGYSTSLLAFIDKVRRHFSFGVWLTPGFASILTEYGFRFTLSGVMKADPIDQDGLVMGWKIIMDSIAIDNDTNYMVESSATLEFPGFLNNPPTPGGPPIIVDEL